MVSGMTEERKECAVWNFPVEVTYRFDLEIPAGATFLSVAVQHGVPMMWFTVPLIDDTDLLRFDLRRFEVWGTGHKFEVNEERRFLGSFMMKEGAQVFHLFEVTP